MQHTYINSSVTTFKAGSHYIALAGLEFTLKTRPDLTHRNQPDYASLVLGQRNVSTHSAI